MRTTMKAAITACALSVVSSVALSTSALAAPIYNSGETSTIAFGTPSDLSFNQAWASSFDISNDATVRSISWDGFYSGGDATTDNFTINIYSNLREAPAFSTNVNGTVEREDSGLDSLFGSDIYTFSANVDDFELEAGTSYFLSIVADTSNNFRNTWAWAGDDNLFSMTGFGSRNGSAFSPVMTYQSIFTLDDAKLPTANVSEPGTLALLLGGVVALAARRRKA